MILLGFRRKLTALALCKSIESAIQWFQIHHGITFATIRNPVVYLSGARVSIFSTLVPRLYDETFASADAFILKSETTLTPLFSARTKNSQRTRLYKHTKTILIYHMTSRLGVE